MTTDLIGFVSTASGCGYDGNLQKRIIAESSTVESGVNLMLTAIYDRTQTDVDNLTSKGLMNYTRMQKVLVLSWE